MSDKLGVVERVVSSWKLILGAVAAVFLAGAALAAYVDRFASAQQVATDHADIIDVKAAEKADAQLHQQDREDFRYLRGKVDELGKTVDRMSREVEQLVQRRR